MIIRTNPNGQAGGTARSAAHPSWTGTWVPYGYGPISPAPSPRSQCSCRSTQSGCARVEDLVAGARCNYVCHIILRAFALAQSCRADFCRISDSSADSRRHYLDGSFGQLAACLGRIQTIRAGIGTVVEFSRGVAFLSLTLTPTMAVLCLCFVGLILVVSLLRKHPYTKENMWMLLTSMLCWSVLVLFFTCDPGGVVTWFFD